MKTTRECGYKRILICNKLKVSGKLFYIHQLDVPEEELGDETVNHMEKEQTLKMNC